jgi:predicted NUDIX family phosphoesterase
MEAEQVWVVPRAELFPGGAPHGFWAASDSFLRRIREGGFFAPRPEVEEDPSLKQVIPYGVLWRPGRIFLFRRSRKGGDSRLHDLRSVGVGGHVNPPDREDVVLRALAREIGEEVALPEGWTPRIAGFLNDDSTPVGSVHVGVVVSVEVPPGPVEVRERDRMSGSFLAMDELLRLHSLERGGFETWSALLLDRIHEVLSWPRPHASSTTTPSPTPTSST